MQATARTNIRPRPCSIFTPSVPQGRRRGLHVVIIGDILFSRVARSNIFALTKLGARHAGGSEHAGAA
jgi:hypothetical protein